RIRFNPHPTGKSPGIAALAAHNPQVPGIAEHDLRLADGRPPKQQRLLCLGVAQAEGTYSDQCAESEAHGQESPLEVPLYTRGEQLEARLSDRLHPLQK